MKYLKNEKEICVGDAVRVEGNMFGIVVCDFDRWTCIDGYDECLVKQKMADGKCLDTGILVKTEEIGMIYYSEQDEAIEAVES